MYTIIILVSMGLFEENIKGDKTEEIMPLPRHNGFGKIAANGTMVVLVNWLAIVYGEKVKKKLLKTDDFRWDGFVFFAS